MVEENYKLYVHIFPHGKRYYGITGQSQVETRWNSGHGYYNQPIMCNAIKKYGWKNIEHIVLFDNLSKEVVCLLEEMYILLYNTRDINFGYNVAKGGEAGLRGIPREESSKSNGHIEGYDKNKTIVDNLSMFLWNIRNEIERDFYVESLLQVFRRDLNNQYSKLDWSLISYEEYKNKFKTWIVDYACFHDDYTGFRHAFYWHINLITRLLITQEELYV